MWNRYIQNRKTVETHLCQIFKIETVRETEQYIDNLFTNRLKVLHT